MKLTVGQAAEVRLGRQRSPEHESGEYPAQYLRSANVADGRLDLSDVKTMNFTPVERAIFALADGDVLMTEGSGSVETVGTSAVWRKDLPGPVCFQNTLIRLRPRAGTTIGPFLAWWARHARVSGQIAAVSSGANIKHLGSDGLKRLTLEVPSLEEQRRIADFLDDRVACIDQIITARSQQLGDVDEAFAAKRRDAVVGGNGEAVSTGLPWAACAPADRPARRLSQVARMGTGHTPSRSEPSYWVDCDIPWLTTSDVHRFRNDEVDHIEDTAVRISPLGLANSAAVLHPAGTVALSRTASAGFSIVMDQAMATSQDFVTWTCGPELRPDFLLHTLRVMRTYLLGNLATGSTHKTIYFPDLMDLRVLVPSVEMQDEAVRCVLLASARRNEVLTALRRQTQLLKEYKRSLITAAVTGELDVTTAGSGIPG